MREAEILRKQEQLARLEESRQMATQRIQLISHDIHRLEQSRYRQRLLQAGKILAKADMLETYHPDKLYAVLMENRERICGMEGKEAPKEI